MSSPGSVPIVIVALPSDARRSLKASPCPLSPLLAQTHRHGCLLSVLLHFSRCYCTASLQVIAQSTAMLNACQKGRTISEHGSAGQHAHFVFLEYTGAVNDLPSIGRCIRLYSALSSARGTERLRTVTAHVAGFWLAACMSGPLIGPSPPRISTHRGAMPGSTLTGLCT